MGKLGIGTTSPTLTLSVSGNSFFGGNATTTGIIEIQGAGTSTFTGGLAASALRTTSSTATSTFANGLILQEGSLQLARLPSCLGGSVLETDAAGTITCGADAGVYDVPGQSWELILSGTQPRILAATSTNIGVFIGSNALGNYTEAPKAMLAIAGTSTASVLIHASSTQGATGDFIRFTNSAGGSIFSVNSAGGFVSSGSSTAAGIFSTNMLSVGTTTFSVLQGDAIGTSTIQGFLNVTGANSTSTFTGGLAASALRTTSSTATSTFANGLILQEGSLQLARLTSCLGGSVLETDAAGTITCGADGGVYDVPGQSWELILSGTQPRILAATSTNIGVFIGSNALGNYTEAPKAMLAIAGTSTASVLIHASSTQGAKGDFIRFTNSAGGSVFSVNSAGGFVSSGSSTAAGIFSTNMLSVGTTTFSVLQGDAIGTSTIQGFLNVTGANSTSTFTGGLAASALRTTSSTATSTFANGLILQGGSLQLASLPSCLGGSVLETDAAGVITCGTDDQAAAAVGDRNAWDLLATPPAGVKILAATTTNVSVLIGRATTESLGNYTEAAKALLAIAGTSTNSILIHASSTQGATGDFIRFTNSAGGSVFSVNYAGGFVSSGSSTAAGIFSTNMLSVGTTTFSVLQGDTIGTSTIQGFLNVTGANSTSTFTGGLSASALRTTSSTATSTFANGLILQEGSLQLARLPSCLGGSVLETDAAGTITCGADAGVYDVPGQSWELILSGTQPRILAATSTNIGVFIGSNALGNYTEAPKAMLAIAGT